MGVLTVSTSFSSAAGGGVAAVDRCSVVAGGVCLGGVACLAIILGTESLAAVFLTGLGSTVFFEASSFEETFEGAI